MNLRECADTLDGYGADLARKLIESPADMSEADADALFRTLVLDDGIELDDARQAFSEASDAIAESRPLAEDSPEENAPQILALACSDLARALIRSLSDMEHHTLHAVEESASNVLGRRSSTLHRLKFLGLTEVGSDGRTVLSRTGKTVRMFAGGKRGVLHG